MKSLTLKLKPLTNHPIYYPQRPKKKTYIGLAFAKFDADSAREKKKSNKIIVNVQFVCAFINLAWQLLLIKYTLPFFSVLMFLLLPDDKTICHDSKDKPLFFSLKIEI